MAQLCVQGSVLVCSFGAAPSTLQVTSPTAVSLGGRPAATVMDHAPVVNVPPFGLCSSPANPAVAAALGPAPCLPATPAPWAPGAPAIRAGRVPVLHAGCTLHCLWSGLITVSAAGQASVLVD